MKRELEKIMIEDVEFAYDSEKEYIKDGHAYCKVCHERKDGDVMEFFGNKMILRVVYSKGKNAKKFRRGKEYGSARWGTRKDIEP